MLRATPGAKNMAGTHSPGVMVDEYQRSKFHVFGILRDPWSWYQSLWCHAAESGPRYTGRLEMWGSGSFGFDDVLPRWVSGKCPPQASAWPGVIWEHHPKRRMQWRHSEGLWSFAVRYFFQDNADRWLVDELIPMADGSQAAALMGLSVEPSRNTREQRIAARPARSVPPLPGLTVDQHALIEAADGSMYRAAQGLTRQLAA